jgi:hypothetical protein
VVQPEFFLQLLVRLLADPPGFDRGGKRLEADVGRQIGDVVFLLACRSPLANQPDLLAGPPGIA